MSKLPIYTIHRVNRIRAKIGGVPMMFYNGMRPIGPYLRAYEYLAGIRPDKSLQVGARVTRLERHLFPEEPPKSLPVSVEDYCGCGRCRRKDGAYSFWLGEFS